MKNKTNSIFDILKVILALMVVLIHGKILFNYVYPWIRIAVPLFFVISSYFLFSKLNKVTDEKERNSIVKNFVIRNLKLYIIWFIIFLPLTIINGQYFVGCCFMQGLVEMIKDFLLHSTFPSSWFIIALIEGVLIIYFGSKKINNKLLFAFGLLTNIFVIITCSYMFLFPKIDFLGFYSSTGIYPNNCFIVGLLWIIIGKIFAENKDKIKKYNRKSNIIFIVLTGILLYFEWYFVKVNALDPNRPCFFMLIPFVCFIFYYVINMKPIYFKESLLLRKMSTVIYVSHKAFIIIFLNYVGLNNRYLVVIISVILSVILTFIVDWLSKHFNFMKNAY